jgi:hypothetical protein
VDEIGFKAKELTTDTTSMTEEKWIELKILLDLDGGTGARKLEGAEFVGLIERRGAISRTDTEKRKTMTLGVSNKVAAGMCDSVDLMERIRKIRNAGQRHGITLLEDRKLPKQFEVHKAFTFRWRSQIP